MHLLLLRQARQVTLLNKIYNQTKLIFYFFFILYTYFVGLWHLGHLTVLSIQTCFLPVDGEGLTRWLLLWHADDAGRAAVGAPKA